VHYLRYWHKQEDLKAYRSALFTLLAQTGEHESLQKCIIYVIGTNRRT